jgi:hypothetical protein
MTENQTHVGSLKNASRTNIVFISADYSAGSFSRVDD